MASRRALHFVFKVANRTATAKFYRDVLGMKVLRHEEFEEGCKASCNGPYDGKWSKTMVGYGPEDDHFVVELTYNYGIKEYELGNDFLGFHVASTSAIENAKKAGYEVEQLTDGGHSLKAPGGYNFNIVPNGKSKSQDPVIMISLGVKDLKKSLDYWTTVVGMTASESTDSHAVLSFSDNQCKLELVSLGQDVNHATAFGRVAFSCPRTELQGIEKSAKDGGHTVLTPLVSLDTPGKATVEVVILADPDGHEICFVGDEAFRTLSQPDPNGDKLLDDAIAADKSDEWFAKRNAKKTAK